MPPHKIVYRNDPDYDTEGDVMEFRLTYEGDLFSSNNGNPRATHKHDIRKHFHRQLKTLWEITSHLKALPSPDADAAKFKIPTPRPRGTPDPDAPVKRETRSEYLARNYSRFGFGFVPLVTEDLSLWCGIDILFLRQGVPGKIFESGDIDNRIKTLFDALKMPGELAQLGDHKHKGPSADEIPFFCLLQDDGLVAKVSVETDTLLEPIVGGIPSDNDARVVITVNIRPSRVLLSNIGFV
jgi:hypothetical protein